MFSFLRRKAASSPSFVRSNTRTLRTISELTLALPILLFLTNNTFQIMWISGRSMSPFLNTDYNRSTSKDAVLVSLWRPTSNLHRGDVVAFWTPHHPERMAVKRIVAMEGDEVITKESYPLDREIVPQGHLWVEGDNPEGRYSLDSNYFGPIAKSLVVGKVVAGVWPRFAWVSWKNWNDNSTRFRKGVTEFHADIQRPSIFGFR